ncbi:MAG: DUF4230 domain-containing protein [Heliobacteriaceae bacterium]|nr:DUF4230 domain-containing protein [Heliobacteriaceae bacterium]MDD4588064.1 DUF4230 domain-containing protein [Heliobacteriaceae bacterium]
MPKTVKTLFVYGLLLTAAFFLGKICFEYVWPPYFGTAVNKTNEANKDFVYLIEEIKEQAKLATVEYSGPVIIKFNDQTNLELFKLPIPVPGTKREYVAVGRGKVVAGIDVEQISITNTAGDSVIVQTPKPQILYKMIENDSWEILVNNSFFRKMTIEEIHVLESEALTDYAKQAEQSGILDTADKKAKDVIRQVLKKSGVNDIQFQ